MDRKLASPIPASAAGIVHCLRQLAEEATSLGLAQSSICIREALEIVAIELSFHVKSDSPVVPVLDPEESVAQAGLGVH